MNEIKYKTVIELGFKRQNVKDDVFFDHYGYDYFIVILKLTVNFYIDWDTHTRQCRLIRIDKRGNIKAEFDICNENELIKYINFFTAK